MRGSTRAYNGVMTRRFLILTVCLSATVAFLVGLIVAGSMTPATAVSAERQRPLTIRPASVTALVSGAPSFADVAARLNPAVVNIDAISRGNRRRRAFSIELPDSPDLFDSPQSRDREGPAAAPAPASSSTAAA